MEKKKFLNEDQLNEFYTELFKGEVSEKELLEHIDEVEDYAWYSTQSTIEDMDKYVHMKDTKIVGNFCNIRQDWDYDNICHFVKSEVRPWGRFEDVIKSIDDGTISDDDLSKFQTWAFDWFLTAFGTYNLRYNFNTWFYEYIKDYDDEL